MSEDTTKTVASTPVDGGGAPAQPQGNAPQGAQAPAAELTVQDLGVLKTIIEVAQSRGAFKANELEAIGKTFNKLDTFLTTVQNQQVTESANAPTMPAAPATAPGKDTPVSPADASAVLGA
mgnify:CR=1 FL=1